MATPPIETNPANPKGIQLETDFHAALNLIGFTPIEQEGIIDYTGCRNMQS
jgi:hypothetical protein